MVGWVWTGIGQFSFHLWLGLSSVVCGGRRVVSVREDPDAGIGLDVASFINIQWRHKQKHGEQNKT